MAALFVQCITGKIAGTIATSSSTTTKTTILAFIALSYLSN